jgi:CHAT domain-containing protein
MGRQVFMETGLARRVPSRRQGRVRPLIIGDPRFDTDLVLDGGLKPPRQLAGARAEAEQVASWFERTADEIGSVIDFKRDRDTRIHCRVTSADLRALLREGGYDIVHFAGHGVFRENDPLTSAWLMSDGPSTSERKTSVPR